MIPPLTKRRGFTLIELLVSISIVAFIVGFSVANFRSIGRDQQVGDEARQLVNVLHETEQRAVNGVDVHSGQSLLVKERYAVVVKGNGYQVMVDSDATGTLGVLDGNEVVLSAHTLPVGITLTTQPANDPTVIGFPSGQNGFVFNATACVPSAQLLLILTKGTQAKAITLQCLTGIISLP